MESLFNANGLVFWNEREIKVRRFMQETFIDEVKRILLNDYHEKVLNPIKEVMGNTIGLDARIVESDRLPSYSLRTMDVEVNNGEKWMEVCSISKRIDFPQKIKFAKKGGGLVERELIVLEIAIGLDRCIYNYFKKHVTRI